MFEKFLKKAGVDLPVKIESLRSEASSRSYFRLQLSKPFRGFTSLVLCTDLPKPYHDQDHFIELNYFLQKNSIAAPEIFAIDEEKGYLLLYDAGHEEFGDYLQLLQKKGDSKAIHILFDAALDLIANLQKLSPPNIVLQRSFHKAKLQSEIDFLYKNTALLCETFRQKNFISVEFQFFIQELCTYLGQKEKDFVFVHRDFHSRNIMIISNETSPSLCLLDFQDACMGRCSYDIVSLIYDPYLFLEPKLRIDLLSRFQNLIGVSNEEPYSLQALQRVLKAMGTYLHQIFQKKRCGYISALYNAVQIADDIISTSQLPHCCHLFLEDFQDQIYPWLDEFNQAL